jgi:hypothetical protein
MHAPGQRPAQKAREPLQADEQERRDQRDREGERDDVAARGAARGKELRTAPEQTQERHRDCESPERGDVGGPLEPLTPTHRAHSSAGDTTPRLRRTRRELQELAREAGECRPRPMCIVPTSDPLPNLSSGEMGERGNQWPEIGLGRTPRDRGEAQYQREPDS